MCLRLLVVVLCFDSGASSELFSFGVLSWFWIRCCVRVVRVGYGWFCLSLLLCCVFWVAFFNLLFMFLFCGRLLFWFVLDSFVFVLFYLIFPTISCFVVCWFVLSFVIAICVCDRLLSAYVWLLCVFLVVLFLVCFLGFVLLL